MSLNTADFDFVRTLVQRGSAIVLPDDKNYLAEARLQIVAQREGLTSVNELIARLRADPQHHYHQKVVEAMTTNETSFYRDIQPFEALRKVVLPEIIQQRLATKTLNIWSAASSTGQEAYSIAMVIRDHFPMLSTWNVQILGTDLSRTVLEKARLGRYRDTDLSRGLSTSQITKYFQKKGTDWEVGPSLKSLVDFQRMNLNEPWPALPSMDIVFLRNVLIYFDVETKKRILARTRTVLRPDGFLFLGGAETPMNLDNNFERVNFDHAGCYRYIKK